MKRKGTRDLTLTKRRQLETLLKAGLHKKQIAKQLGVFLSTEKRLKSRLIFTEERQ